MESEEVQVGQQLPDVDYQGVLRALPHRYPMLLVDGLVEIEAFRRGVGIKNVTFNEPYFQGHFPGDPIMPGVLIVEAMGQTAAVLIVASMGARAGGNHVYFTTVDEARFRRPVRPGAQLRLEVELQRQRMGIWKFKGRAVADGQVCTEATFSAKVVTGAA
ncbi:3-hydroxyacyl-ACP dehydratase FabZ [Geminicoccaceae bacterium 1502E]|nr:3-hydroxyacyl-ACP dehydratase FabZ [Geminicoccaceae bacterium 1502E]